MNELNHTDDPADPFGPSPVPEPVQAAYPGGEFTAYQQARANDRVLSRLRHELTAPPLDADRIKAEVIRHNQTRKAGIGGADLDAEAEIARRGADYAAADWSHLDRLAITRAAIWITHADGYGQGVAYDEAMQVLTPHDAGDIPATARAIVLRLSQIVAAPDADGVALARSDALSGIVARDDQPGANA